MELAIDIFDNDPETKFKPKLVLVLHEEYPGSTKIRLEDEDFLRNELGITEKGKWYRHFGAFDLEDMEHYKAHIPGPNPS